MIFEKNTFNYCVGVPLVKWVPFYLLSSEQTIVYLLIYMMDSKLKKNKFLFRNPLIYSKNFPFNTISNAFDLY